MTSVETIKIELFDIIRQQALHQQELNRLEQIKQAKVTELEKAEADAKAVVEKK